MKFGSIHCVAYLCSVWQRSPPAKGATCHIDHNRGQLLGYHVSIAVSYFGVERSNKRKGGLVSRIMWSPYDGILAIITFEIQSLFLNSVRILLGKWVGLNRQASADGSSGRRFWWWECMVADFERVMNLFRHPCYVYEVPIVRPIESAVPSGLFGSISFAALQDKCSSPSKEETPKERSPDGCD